MDFAQDLQQKGRHSFYQGTYISPTKLTVKDFMERWLRDYVAIQVRRRTAEEYESKVKHHVIPCIGHIILSELQPAHLQEFYRDRLERGRLDGKGGLSPQTVKHIHTILSEALSHGVKWGLVIRNVAQAIDAPHVERKDIQVLDSPDVHRFLEVARDTEPFYYAPIFTEIYSGLRRSELLGLRWKDVDLDMGTSATA
jgi:integrase